MDKLMALLEQDQEFAKKLSECASEDAIKNICHEAGVELTDKDAAGILTGMNISRNGEISEDGELSEENLAGVSGGITVTSVIVGVAVAGGVYTIFRKAGKKVSSWLNK